MSYKKMSRLTFYSISLLHFINSIHVIDIELHCVNHAFFKKNFNASDAENIRKNAIKLNIKTECLLDQQPALPLLLAAQHRSRCRRPPPPGVDIAPPLSNSRT